MFTNSGVITNIGALVFLAVMVSIVHEAGHALVAPLAGYRLTSFSIGWGRAIFRHRTTNGTVFHLGLFPFTGGRAVAIPVQSLLRANIYHLGGIGAQVVMAPLLFMFRDIHWLVAEASLLNLLVLAWHLLPWRVQGHSSDGWLIWAHRGSPSVTGAPLGQRRLLQSLKKHELKLGSHLGAWYASLCLAWLDVVTGRPQDADGFFAEPTVRLPGSTVPFIAGLWLYVAAEWHRASDRPLGSLHLLRGREPTAAFISTLLLLAEARAYLAIAEQSSARRALAQLAGTSGPALGDAGIIQLELALGDSSLRLVERATQNVLQTPNRPFLDPISSFSAMLRASEYLEAHGNPDIAIQLNDMARLLVARMLAQADPQDRPQILASMDDSRLKAAG